MRNKIAKAIKWYGIIGLLVMLVIPKAGCKGPAGCKYWRRPSRFTGAVLPLNDSPSRCTLNDVAVCYPLKNKEKEAVG